MTGLPQGLRLWQDDGGRWHDVTDGTPPDKAAAAIEVISIGQHERIMASTVRANLEVERESWTDDDTGPVGY